MSDLLIHLTNYGTLVLCAVFFVGALLWTIRPGGVSLLARLSPRERGLSQARQELNKGDWQAAFTMAGQLRNPKRTDRRFEQRLLNFEGDCLYRAAELALQARRYAEALELMRGAGDRLGLPEVEFDKRIAELLLAELRRRVASDPTSQEIRRLTEEVMRLQPGHPEASFWLGLHHLHSGRKDSARDALYAAVAEEQVADGALYLGALLLQTEQPFDAARSLRQSLSVAPECPIIQAQYGAALLATDDNAAAAVEALEQVLGPDGLERFAETPEKLWSTLGPRSWLAALSKRAPVTCPLGLDRIDETMASARRSLAGALERCDRATDAASVYFKAFAAGDHSLAVRKGLGLSLSRAGMHDDALPHLQAAYERENPPSPALISHFSLTLARARTEDNADQLRHIHQALGVLTSVEVRDNPEWSGIARDVMEEAKKADVDLTQSQRVALARAFASAGASDPIAIDTFDRLGAEAATMPLEAGAAYVRAAVEFGACGHNDEAIFNRVFREREGFKRICGERKWEFAKAERLYLERWAQRHPGRYPDGPGPLYGAIAERMLTDEWRRHSAAGRPEDARAAIDLAFRLGPTRALTLDRLAEQADRRGDHEDVVQYLDTWTRHHPNDIRPVVRRALLDRREGRSDQALERLSKACETATGQQRAKLLMMTARIALSAKDYAKANALFEQARNASPQDAEPLIGLAAIAWQTGEFDRLAAMAPLFDRPGPSDPLRSLLAAAAFALAGDEARSAVELAIAASEPSLTVETAILRTAILIWQNRDSEAKAALETASQLAGQNRDGIQALQGQLAWRTRDYATALLAWGDIPLDRRNEWQLNQHFAAAAFLYGASEMIGERPTEALEWFRQARENGYKHRQLPLMEAVVRQRLNQAAVGDADQIRQLEAALPTATRDANTTAWLARSFRRAGDICNCRRILNEVKEPSGHSCLQRGLLALLDNKLSDAETEFAAARELLPDSLPVEYDLAFTQLTSGRNDESAESFERAARLHPNSEAKRILTLLAAIAPKAPRNDVLATMTTVDEQRLIKRIQQIGRVDTVLALMQTLAQLRPDSSVVVQALTDAYVLWMRNVLDRGEPEIALNAATTWPAAPARPLGNLLGVAAALAGRFSQALTYFQAALPTAEDDARVQQNLAMVLKRLGDLGRSKHHWKRFLFGQPAHCPAPPGDPDYLFRVGEIIRHRLEDIPTEVAA